MRRPLLLAGMTTALVLGLAGTAAAQGGPGPWYVPGAGPGGLVEPGGPGPGWLHDPPRPIPEPPVRLDPSVVRKGKWIVSQVQTKALGPLLCVTLLTTDGDVLPYGCQVKGYRA